VRPHPLLAITSAIFVLGAAGAIGDAATSAKSSILTLFHRHAPTRVFVRATTASRLTAVTSTFMIGDYHTSPIPYLFASLPTVRQRIRAISLRVRQVHASADTAASGSPWLALRECESGDNYSENTGNGFYGAYQFSASTWWNLGYSGLPNLAPAWEQDAAAARLQRLTGWSAWPICSEIIGV
jgi:hypothetical protein